MAGFSKKVVRLGGPLLAVAVLAVAALWLSGAFERGRIPPGEVEPPPGPAAPEFLGRAEIETRPVFHASVGTVTSRTEATVAAQVSGRVSRVRVDAGSEVSRGDLLAVLDSQETDARAGQARSALEAALAQRADAEQHFQRMERLLREKAAPPVEMEAAEVRLKRARAAVGEAENRLQEARIVLDYANIRTPMNGVVTRREVDPGDLAHPGRPLFVLHNPTGLRLEAQVGEGLIGRVRRGQAVQVELAALVKTVEGTVEEIVPLADFTSRSFLVRVALPETEGLHPGMFARLRLPLGERSTILIPREAVSRVGQLQTVLVLDQDRWVRRYVTLGEPAAERVEVLSGLEGGETIGWNRQSAARGITREEGADAPR